MIYFRENSIIEVTLLIVPLRCLAGYQTIPSVECYDHVTEEWCHAASMNVNRSALKVTVFKMFYCKHFQHPFSFDNPLFSLSLLSLTDTVTLRSTHSDPVTVPVPVNVYIVSMVMGSMGVESILPVTIETIIKLDGDGVEMCKQAIIIRLLPET